MLRLCRRLKYIKNENEKTETDKASVIVSPCSTTIANWASDKPWKQQSAVFCKLTQPTVKIRMGQPLKVGRPDRGEDVHETTHDLQ